MDKSLFTPNALGRIVKITSPWDDYAFIPAPLPSKLEIPNSTMRLLMAAREEIARLDGIGRHMRNQHDLLLKPLQQREALRSSSMEGTFATPEEMLLYQASPKEPKSSKDRVNSWREVANYSTALRLGQEIIEGGNPLSLNIIRALHHSLLSGVRGEEKSPGEFRNIQVQVGVGGRFIPPPPQDVRPCLDELDQSLYGRGGNIDPLIWLFMVHYQFETIHPFKDGNGRVGRLLLSLQVSQLMNLAAPWLYMSAYFEKHKNDYIDLLFRVSSHGDWISWIDFCLYGATEQAKDSISRFDSLVLLKEEYHEKVVNSGGSSRLHSLVDCLFESPLTTVMAVVEKCSVTYPTAKSDVTRLVDLGILQKGHNLRPQYYFSPEIMRIAYSE